MAGLANPPMAPRKRKRVPEILWRLFGNRARTLADTILALIPPPLPACRSKRCRCLYCCSRDKAMSFLVRSRDSLDYRKLLTETFVVVSDDAPPLPVFDHHCRLSQLQIVRRTIEMILHEQPSSSNLICFSYDKESQSCPAVDELTSSKWALLLKRVGDALMTYLLKNTYIFLPLPRNKHHQISGCPVGNLCSKFSRNMPKFGAQHHPPAHTEYKIKRQRAEGPRKQLQPCTLGSEPYSNSTSFAASNGSSYVSEELPHLQIERSSKQNIVKPRKRMREHSWQRKRKRRHLAVSGMPSLLPSTGNSSTSDDLALISRSSGNDIMHAGSTCVSEELPHIQSEGNCNQNTVKSRKRGREYRWQRKRKRKQLAVSETPSLLTSRGSSSASDNLSLISSLRQNDMGNMTHFFCHLVFQTQPRMKGNAEIDRRNIFYRIENCSSMFPRKHILHTLKPNDSGASILFNNIFEAFGPDKISGSMPCCHTKNDCSINSTCLYHSLKVLLKNLIRESRKCRQARLLEKHCSVGSSYQDASRGAGTGLEVAMAKNRTMIQEINAAQAGPIMCCLKTQVVSFIWAICRRIVPPPLLGERSNWRCLRRNISKFIRLRRFEKFSLKECIYKLKISKFPIFSNKHNEFTALGITDISRHAILECWMLWFFTHIVSPLVQANFYVTESEHEKQEVLYYQKSTWEKLMRENECMIDDRYHLLDYKSARNILWKRSFGFSRSRLLPKGKGFRILTNLRAPSRFPVDTPSRIQSNHTSWRKVSSKRRAHRFFKSVNSVLHDVHVVLTGLRAKEPENLGSSVFNYNDAYKKLVPFLFHLKNGSLSLPNVFMVVSDVSKAFDSVNHEKLLSVMKDAICDDEYYLEKFTHVVCTGKYLKIEPRVMLAHQDIRTASTRMRSRIHCQSLDSIVLKKDANMKIRKEEILSLLKEHITRNMVQFRNKFYLQQVGIPQGSVLSALLCSFYYEHMERNVIFPFLEKASRILLVKQYSCDDTSVSGDNHNTEIAAAAPGCKSLLLRFIDDFLFISPSKKQASMFFTRMERGVRDYNCCMNKEKYGLNFIMENQHGPLSNRVYTGKDNISFLFWSGLLVNCSTLEIQADYTRYLNHHMRSTLTVSRQGKVGNSLKSKLRNYLRPKCHPIFYDSNINSPGVVRLNIYQAFLLCAMKFICHLSNLSIIPKFHPKFLLKAIETSLRYMNRLIRRRMYSFKGAGFRPRYNVGRKDVIWLGLYAYSRVLLKKHLRHNSLLFLLRAKLKAYGEVENMSPELKYAVDDVHSSVLWSIKY
ncbi:telomerase reverse transcriptase-like isoform X1 [Salvia hispanica]|uniref:telomerase reverse transcriptase-like isoform X1 n=1 Tax=Salvia hispanica TaxID=49212 RepID=UPI002009B1ED|nr:telomerase reverse transcriptase-like isoform X1 [Salvia hispanica]